LEVSFKFADSPQKSPHFPGAFTASLCIAPAFTGTITSLSSFVGGLANIAVPTVVGLLNKTGTRAEWNVIFFIATGVSFFTGLFFLIFGSGCTKQAQK
jgi:hypothetical protein